MFEFDERVRIFLPVQAQIYCEFAEARALAAIPWSAALDEAFRDWTFKARPSEVARPTAHEIAQRLTHREALPPEFRDVELLIRSRIEKYQRWPRMTLGQHKEGVDGRPRPFICGDALHADWAEFEALIQR